MSGGFGAYHLCDSSVSEDVASVDEAVEHLGRLLDQIALVGIVLQLFIYRSKTNKRSYTFELFKSCENVLRNTIKNGASAVFHAHVRTFRKNTSHVHK